MKAWYRSVTIWSALVAVLGLVITRLASGKSVGEIVTDPEVQSGTADLIGFVLSALGAAGVLYGRITANSAIAPSITGRTDDESGRAGVGLLAALATAGLFPLLAWLTRPRESKKFKTQWLGDRPPQGEIFRMAFLGWVRVTDSGPASLTVQRCSRLVSGWLGLVHWMRARGALALSAGLVMLALALALGGCGPRMVVAERSVRLDVWPGPPCLIRVEVDGELVARVDWTKRCDVGAPPADGAGEVAP